jgi:hypothetical protein
MTIHRAIISVSLCLCMLAGAASAASVVYREGGGTGCIDATFDQTDVVVGDDTFGRYDYYATGASSPEYTLIGLKDLFSLVAINGPDDVQSATLTIYAYQGDNDFVTVRRATTDWLVRPAGQNCNNVTGLHSDYEGGVAWSAGAFSSADYDATGGVTIQWGPSCYNDPYAYDVTAMVRQMYRTGRNCGFVVSAPQGTGVYAFSDNQGTVTLRPNLAITYELGAAPTKYALTVNSGSGGGQYWEGYLADISAGAAPVGQVFDAWTGDVAALSDAASPATTVTMPASAVTVTATYRAAVTYLLTVNSGSGGGAYAEGTPVEIIAGAAPGGMMFAGWVGDTATIDAADAPVATLTMPGADAEVTATFAIPHLLTVNSGTGSGDYIEGTVVGIVADEPPSGYLFDGWEGDTDPLDNAGGNETQVVMPDTDVEITATYRENPAYVDWYARFNQFCTDNFGAEIEPLAYDMFGQDLQFIDTGEWSYVSEHSAVLGFETNLPADAWVEYGETASYGMQAGPDDRRYYLHVVYLHDLDNNTTYHYRYVATDERGHVITSEDKTFTTHTPANVVYVPGSMGSPPYNLTQAGKTYVVTQDIVANGTAFEVGADDVTLDLGGHTVIYNNTHQTDPTGDFWAFIDGAVQGVFCHDRNNFNLYNGTIKQGEGMNGATACGIGYSPYFAYSSSGTVAGITADYKGDQLSGIDTKWSGPHYFHHNVVLDRGIGIDDRQAAMFGIADAADIHHNLIKRVRHCGISGSSNNDVHSNEVYVDSCATNAFCVNFYATHDSECYDNRFFGTGYLVIGVGTVSNGVADVMVHDNYIHLQAVEPDSRWSEYGSQSGAYCCRITWGGNNIQYYDNYMITYGRDGGMVRGTWFHMTPDKIDCVYRNNVVKAVLQNMESDIQGCIVHCGDQDPDDGVLLYENNVVISNFCNVRLGEDYYGAGCNALLVGNTFLKEGPERPDYRTIGVGYGSFRSTGHEFYDSLFGPGAGYDHVRFDDWGPRDITVGWTLTVETEPNAHVTIKDAFDDTVFDADADGEGVAETRLLQYFQTASGKTYHTDHTATASDGEREKTVTVTMDAKKTIQIFLGPVVGDCSGDGFVGQADLDIVLSVWGWTVNPTHVADFNHDGFIGQADLDVVLGNWGQGTLPD